MIEILRNRGSVSQWCTNQCHNDSVRFLFEEMNQVTVKYLGDAKAHQSTARFISFLVVYMSISLFRLFGFCSLLKLVIDTKNILIAVQNWYVPTQDTRNVFSGGKMFFMIYSECLYGLSVDNANEVTL